jgi:hypothetical protein
MVGASLIRTGCRAEARVGEERICLRDAGELAACFAAQAGSLFGYACVLTRGDRALADTFRPRPIPMLMPGNTWWQGGFLMNRVAW